MRVHGFRFSNLLGVALLSGVGMVAATSAIADADAYRPAPTQSAAPGPKQQCDAINPVQAMIRFPVGTTLLQTDAGLIVLSRPTGSDTPQIE